MYTKQGEISTFKEFWAMDLPMKRLSNTATPTIYISVVKTTHAKLNLSGYLRC